MSFVLYWRPGAASMAPHAALAEIGVDYRLVEIGRDEAQEDASYRALNPLGVVPTLVDEEQNLVLTESAAILLYLGDRFPEAQLAPADRADYYRWLVFLTNTVQTAMLRWFYPERYGTGDKGMEAAARDAAEAFDILDRALEGMDLAHRRAPHRRRPIPLHAYPLGTPARAGRRGPAEPPPPLPRDARAARREPHARRAGTGDSVVLRFPNSSKRGITPAPVSAAMSSDGVVLEVENLRTEFHLRSGNGRGGRRRLVHRRRGGVRRARRRVGLRQVDDRPVDHEAAAEVGHVVGGSMKLLGERSRAAERARDAQGARQRRVDDLPGSDDAR